MNEAAPSDDDALTSFDPNAGRAAYWPLAAAAALVGISPRVMAEDIAAGRLPIAVRSFGARKHRFVSSADTLALVASARKGSAS